MNALIINDICSHGIVGSNAIKAILESNGFNVYNLPSLILDTTFNFKGVVKLDTTEYLKACLKKYEESEINFDYILIGYLDNELQAEMLLNYIRNQSSSYVIVDPTMADNGKLYTGMSQSVVSYMDELAKLSDLVVPNITEANLLCNAKDETIDNLILMMKEKYQSFIITSYNDKTNYVYNIDCDELTKVDYNKVGGGYPGTGDLFVGFLISNMKNMKLKEAAIEASKTLTDLIIQYQNKVIVYNGLPISAFLSKATR